METKEIIFNEKERHIIAEFIFSYQTDVLMKSDGLDLIDVLNNHDLITDSEYNNIHVEIINNTCDIHKLARLLSDKINHSIINKIMSEYYGKQRN